MGIHSLKSRRSFMPALLILLTLMTGNAFAVQSDSQTVIIRRGSIPSAQGSNQYYTGSVRIDQPFAAKQPARMAGEQVTFEPGARSAWHDNPMGQKIIILSGKAMFQEENGPVETALAGDVIWFPPRVNHWYGAAPDTAMTSMTLAEAVNGKNVNWRKAVTDEQYTAAANKKSQHLVITKSGSLPSGKGSPDYFTGSVRTDRLYSPNESPRPYGSLVTFEPCARTDWHSHPMGQTLIVTAGRGFVQEVGGPLHELNQGDIAWTPPDVVHWHGASPEKAMSHIALSEPAEGKAVTWGAKVTDAEYGASNPDEMPLRLQKISLIAAFTANGDIPRLKEVLVEGLEAGLTVNEIKEVLIHTYAYAGFPRSLNGILAFNDVMDEREKQSIKDVYGPEASPVASDKSKFQQGSDNLAALRKTVGIPPTARYAEFAPTIEVFLKEHLFADIFNRDVLDYLSRETATVGVLSNLPGVNAQLRSHTGHAMTQGATEAQMRHLFTVLGTYLGKERGDNALAVLEEVIASRKK
ncbi:MAG: cupin domain-containing protein [Desulfovibrio sp.]|jgi:quercetin dioxygenase-like cupin family protein|nr:cupin domain-containing protein [Desulfovibrio sp.]